MSSRIFVCILPFTGHILFALLAASGMAGRHAFAALFAMFVPTLTAWLLGDFLCKVARTNSIEEWWNRWFQCRKDTPMLASLASKCTSITRGCFGIMGIMSLFGAMLWFSYSFVMLCEKMTGSTFAQNGLPTTLRPFMAMQRLFANDTVLALTFMLSMILPALLALRTLKECAIVETQPTPSIADVPMPETCQSAGE